jgi:hypothetical protein
MPLWLLSALTYVAITSAIVSYRHASWLKQVNLASKVWISKRENFAVGMATGFCLLRERGLDSLIAVSWCLLSYAASQRSFLIAPCVQGKDCQGAILDTTKPDCEVMVGKDM